MAGGNIFSDTERQQAQAADPPAILLTGVHYTKDPGTGIVQFFYRDSAGTVHQLTPSNPLLTEPNELIPVPEGSVGGNSTFLAINTFVGSSYQLEREIAATSVLFRVTASTGTGTLEFGFYQAPTGRSGSSAVVADQPVLIASAAGVAIGAGAGDFSVAFGGAVTFSPGVVYFLWRRDSGVGSFTMRTRTVNPLGGCTANVNPSVHPTSFTTGLVALPATIDPRAGSGVLVPSASDVPAAIRLLV